jgi:hypothetical protein
MILVTPSVGIIPELPGIIPELPEIIASQATSATPLPKHRIFVGCSG